MNKKIISSTFLILFLGFNSINVRAESGKIIYSDSFDHLYSLANIEVSQNNKDRAFSYFEAIMQKFPDKIAALYSYKSFCVNNGYYDKAIELNKLLYEETKKESLKEELAYLYQKKGEIDKTINLYEEIIAKKPGKTSIKEKLITELFNHGKFKEAASYCKNLPGLTNNNNLAMICGKSFFYSGDNKSALYSIEKESLSKEDLKFISDVYLANLQFAKAIPYVEQLPANKYNYLKLGDLYAAANDYKKSAENYELFLKYEKNNIKILKKLLNNYYAINNKEKTVEVLEKLIGLNNNDLTSKRKLADLYYSENKLDKANKLYAELYENKPQDKKLLAYLTDINSSLKYYDESIKYQKKLIELSERENVRDLKFKLAGLYIANNNLAKAEIIFSELFSKNGNDIESIKKIIDIKLAQNSFVEALNYLNHALAIEPDNQQLKIKMVDTMFALGDPASAKNILEELVKNDSTNIKFVSNLSNSYLAGNNSEKNIELLTNYLQNNDGNKELKVKLSDSYLASGQFDNAIQTLQPLVNKYPEDNNLKTKYADSLLALDRHNEAYEVLRPILNQEKKDTELVKKLANILLTMKKFEQSEVLLSWAHKNNPENDDIKKLLADTNLYLEKFVEAYSYYKEISDINKDEEVVYGMAEANRFLKDYDKADELYNQLLENEKYKLRAKVGKAYMNIDRNELYQAKKDFKEILEIDENNFDAKLGLATAHISTEDFLSGIEILDTLEESDKVRYEKANAYFKMQMYSNALENLEHNQILKAQKLHGMVLNKMEIRATPEFDFNATSFPQGGSSPDTKLRFTRYGIEFSDYPQFLGLEKTNLRLKAKWNITPYYSGSGASSRNALANYYGIGIEGRPLKKLATDNEIGVKFFNTGDGLIEAKSLWDIHLNDMLKLHFGYERFNIEETLLSTAGIKPVTGPFAGTLVGQAVNNKFKLFGYTLKFPYDWFSYGSFNLGNISGINIPDNSYSEGVLGMGKVLYTRPEGRLVDLIMPEYTFYYAGYDKNLLGFGGVSLNSTPVGSDGISPFTSPFVGGYFSPEYIISNQMSLHLRGTIKKINTKYYLTGFTGLQNIQGGSMDLTWGGRVKLTYNEEGPVGLGMMYAIEDYNVIMKHYLMLQVLTRW